MTALREGTIGILPAGALGVSFFYHLTGELARVDEKIFFLERTGSTSAARLRQQTELAIADARGVRRVNVVNLWKPDLLACHAAGFLPEILLVCPNPDQLLGVITDVVQLLERIHRDGGLETAALPLPLIVLCANGIYFQRVRQIFLEKLEEATLLGRLPDLWPALMPRLVGRLLRGVTIQTGVREGAGAETIYRPGPRGITRIAGGDATNRVRCAEVLSARGGWFEVADCAPTRVEFDKAMVNLVANLLGQLYAISDAGEFRALTVGEIIRPEHEAEIRQLCEQVFRIGQAVKAYGAQEDFVPVLAATRASLQQHAGHTPSSLQWVALRLRAGQLDASLTPTEAWLLDPLMHYARSAGLEQAGQFLAELKQRLLARLALAQKNISRNRS